MDPKEVRIECLRLAVQVCGESNDIHVVSTAKAFENYIMGTDSQDKLEK